LWSGKAREEGQKGVSIPDGDRHILLFHHIGELGKVGADAIAVVLLPRDCAVCILFDWHLNNVGPRAPCPHGEALPRLVIAGKVAPAAAGERELVEVLVPADRMQEDDVEYLVGGLSKEGWLMGS
jgi:hypothetical protein